MRPARTAALVVALSLPAFPLQDPMAELARGCAQELPWCFDAEEARARAAAEGKPILVYVRCTDDRDHLASAERSIAATEIRFQDDGYCKDLLFRAGPLSDPEVASLVERRFVPLCLTYVLGDHTYGAETPAHWGATGGAGTVRFAVDEHEGHGAPGSLSIANEDPADQAPHNWTQAIDPPAELPAALELEASVKARGLERGAKVGVMVQCWKGQEMIATAHLNEVSQEADWKPLKAKFRAPEGTESIRLRAYLVGAGSAWFDDLAIRPGGKGAGRPNLLLNGGVDQVTAEGTFGELGLSPRRLTTPALVVVDPADGRPARRFHRMGALSSELVDRWLRAALGELGDSFESEDPRELYLAGEPERALALLRGASEPELRLLRARCLLRTGALDDARRALAGQRGPAASLVAGRVLLREGRWEEAAEAFERAAAGEGEAADEAGFWRALALERLGRHAEARGIWEQVAGESRFGRKAACCLLRAGPRLFFAETVRAWPESAEPPEETELGHPAAFDLQQSVSALLEMQRADGSFGGHLGVDGHGYADAAITALVCEALGLHEGQLADELRERAQNARRSALEFLVAWPDRAPPPGTGLDAFNNPYVLMTLVADGRTSAARRVIERVAASQQEDGNWTVYHPERPASFNTALNVLALVEAKAARIEVPKETLKNGIAALEAMRQEGGHFPYSTADGHAWMTTDHGSIARDPLCELTLLACKKGSKRSLEAALERYATYAHELRVPTKRLYDYFNSRGHGGYFFFFAHRNAADAARLARSSTRKRVLAIARDEVLAAREGDGTFVDKFLLGRAYGTAMALLVLAD